MFVARLLIGVGGLALGACAGARPPDDPAAEDRAFTAVLRLDDAARASPAPPRGLSPEDRALVEASDAFTRAYPRSVHTAEVGYAAARAMYERGDLDQAVVRFAAIALAPDCDRDRCVVAANLVLDALTAQQDFDALDSFLRRYQTSACERAHQPVPQAVPARATPADPRLDALGFLTGCWRHWTVDWGFTLCWQREENVWVGSAESYGAMGDSELVLLQIASGPKGPTLTSGERKGWWLWADLSEAELAVSTPNSAAFGTGNAKVELVRDFVAGTLLLKRGGIEYLLRPQRMRR